MTKSKLFVGLLLVAVLAIFAPASHAQTATNCQSTGSPTNCNVMAVGSSAIFPSAAIAAVSGDPTRGNGPLCNNGATTGTRFWTGAAFGHDARNTVAGVSIPDEPGTVWIAWDNDTAPTIICTYLSVDSIVGQRLFYGQGAGVSGPTNNGTLLLNPEPSTSGHPAACLTAGGNKVVFVWDTPLTGLPSAIYNALEGTTGTTCPAPVLPVNFTTASTDVAPADALFIGNQRVLSFDNAATADFPTDTKSALGYGGANGCTTPGPAVASAWETTTIANAVCYTYVAGQPDPISTTAIPPSQIVSEGALALIPFANITDTASGGFGNMFALGWNDVLAHDMAAGYAFSQYGNAALTRDLFTLPGASALGIKVVHYLEREPMSGTYTTMEWQDVREKDGLFGGADLSQETNICGPSQGAGCPYKTPANDAVACPNQATNLANGTFPATQTCSNYASWGKNGFNALKTRVLGTGEMVNVANIDCARPGFPAQCNATDQFGYAFWSLGTFGGKTAIRYLQKDSNDGLYLYWTSALTPSQGGGNNGLFPLVDPNQNKVGHPTGLTVPVDGCGGYFNGDGGLTIQNFSCNSWPFPTFANIVSGNYRNWSINRVVWYVSAAGGVLNPNWTTLNAPAFWLSAADQAAPVQGPAPLHGAIPDFMPFGYCAALANCPNNAAPTLTYPLNAFRSHYAIPAWAIGAPANGILQTGFGGVENGGDVAGATITVQAEADTVNVGFWGAGNTFINWLQ